MFFDPGQIILHRLVSALFETRRDLEQFVFSDRQNVNALSKPLVMKPGLRPQKWITRPSAGACIHVSQQLIEAIPHLARRRFIQFNMAAMTAPSSD